MSFTNDEVTTAPAWLRGPWGEALHYVYGLIKDAWTEAAKHSVKARYVASAPVDAIPRLLADYFLDGPFNETAATTKARIQGAWTTWRKAGTPAGIVAALNTAGYGDVTIIERYDPERWWLFRVLLKPPFPWDYAGESILKWGAGWTYGSHLYDGLGTPEDRAYVLALIRKWKPAHTQLEYVSVQLPGTNWGAFNWGGTTQYNRTEDTWR